MITDYSRSYAVFTYYCGDLNYSFGASIGFAAPGGLFANHPAALYGSAQSIACLNSPASPWVNVVYEITSQGNDSPTHTLHIYIPWITLELYVLLFTVCDEGYFYSFVVNECIRKCFIIFMLQHLQAFHEMKGDRDGKSVQQETAWCSCSE